MIVLGIDPGSRYTALVARDTAQQDNTQAAAPTWDVIDRRELPGGEDRTYYAARCVDVAEQILSAAPAAVAIENIVAPTPHGADGDRPRFTNPGPALDTAYVLGYLHGHLSASGHLVILVNPSGFGAPVASRRILEALYPPQLIGPRETTGSGKSPRQHARAAFEIAGAARTLARIHPTA